MRQIRITNSLTGQKEQVAPLEEGHVKMYACGVTVYDHCHIGHAMQAIFFDVIRRYLVFAGYRVTYVRNFTDIDDKIIARAKERDVPPSILADQMVKSCQEDMQAIGVIAADYEPRVSEFITQIIGMIRDLVQLGAAYSTESGDVYYRVRKKTDYGKLSGRRPDELRSGTREIVKSEKEDELDFALWKADDTPGAFWESPWGLGRPGWHIECSVMAKELLGPSFDIHGGGRDLIFPHHENEVAQSESANQAPFASIWVHSGLMTINGQKMSKSLGNHILIKDFLQRYPGEVLRLCVLRHHYSSTIDFSEDLFQGALRRLLYYYETLERLDDFSGGTAAKPSDSDQLIEDFHLAMSDDFNTASTVGSIDRTFKHANQLASGKKLEASKQTVANLAASIRQVGAVLGLFTGEPVAFVSTLRRKALAQLPVDEEKIISAISEREQARREKNFALADRIRDELGEAGIELRDGPGGTTWTVAQQVID